MVSIDVGPYRLESYENGWTTGERRVRKGGKDAGAVYLVGQAYHGSLTQALTSLQDRWVRESDASSFADLRKELKAFRAEVSGLFELQVREPDKSRHRRVAI